jgi:hypothetical protein
MTTIVQTLRRLVGGVVAGAVGTAGLYVEERVERRLLGSTPVYAPARLAARLAARYRVFLGERGSRRLGDVMRWVYGPALGAAHACLDRDPRPGLKNALRLAAAIYGFEVVVLPLVGATPPLRRWPRVQVGSLALHTLAFSACVMLARASRARSARAAWHRRPRSDRAR